jgi:hypothetical protein
VKDWNFISQMQLKCQAYRGIIHRTKRLRCPVIQSERRAREILIRGKHNPEAVHRSRLHAFFYAGANVRAKEKGKGRTRSKFSAERAARIRKESNESYSKTSLKARKLFLRFACVRGSRVVLFSLLAGEKVTQKIIAPLSKRVFSTLLAGEMMTLATGVSHHE